MNHKPSILYVDDEKVNLETFRNAFDSDYSITTVLSAEEALKILEKQDFFLIIADQRMPGMSGIDLCERLLTMKPTTLRMILTAYTETDLLLAAIHRGHVQDYIVKPWKKADVKAILDHAWTDYQEKMRKLQDLQERAIKSDILEDELRSIYDHHGIVGDQSGLRKVMETVKKAAPTDSTILLLGETGTGKELLAHAIHSQSKRSQKPFVPVHCAALSKTLLESELFGHERGAFTGAEKQRIGRFELAHGGTIFLDEIGEIPEEIQVKLLRVLQQREIQRVGGNQIISIDVRLVAATNKDLQEEVRQGHFREDLFYRLNVINVTVPPLRERKEDIPTLAHYFLKKFCAKTGAKLALSEASLRELTRYDWPGNVRELENIIERAVILSAGPQIDPEDLNLRIDEMMKIENVDVEKIAEGVSLKDHIHQREINSLTSALVKANGNISEAARLLGMPRTNFFRRIKKYQLI